MTERGRYGGQCTTAGCIERAWSIPVGAAEADPDYLARRRCGACSEAIRVLVVEVFVAYGLDSYSTGHYLHNTEVLGKILAMTRSELRGGRP